MDRKKKILTASRLFAVSMYFLYGHPRNFKIPAIRPVFLDYFFVSYNYAVKLQACVTNEVVYSLSSIKDDVWYCADTPSVKLKL